MQLLIWQIHSFQTHQERRSKQHVSKHLLGTDRKTPSWFCPRVVLTLHSLIKSKGILIGRSAEYHLVHHITHVMLTGSDEHGMASTLSARLQRTEINPTETQGSAPLVKILSIKWLEAFQTIPSKM